MAASNEYSKLLHWIEIADVKIVDTDLAITEARQARDSLAEREVRLEDQLAFVTDPISRNLERAIETLKKSMAKKKLLHMERAE